MVFSSIGCCDWWCACSLCTVWVLSPLSFLQYFTDMPFHVWYLWYHFSSSFGLLLICYIFSIYFAYNITWFVVCIFLFVFDITWYMYYGDYGLYFGGGSYSSVYVPPPLYVFPVVLMVCIPPFFFFIFLLCFVYLLLDSHIPLVLLLPICVCFIHAWMKTFGGCMHIHFTICSYICVLKYIYLIYFTISGVTGQDSKAKHVIFW